MAAEARSHECASISCSRRRAPPTASASAVLDGLQLVERVVGVLGFEAKLEQALNGLIGHGPEVAYLVERKTVWFGKT